MFLNHYYLIRVVKMTYDVIGDIAVLSFRNKERKEEKIKLAKNLLKQKNIRVVLEKSERVKGRLRTIKTKFLAGEKRKETVYKENECKFLLNVEKCYFSGRLSEERKRVSEEIVKRVRREKRRGKIIRILVMFSGVGPFSIVLGKKLSKEGLLDERIEIFSNELGRECIKYQEKNLRLNKLKEIKIVSGDANKLPLKLRGKKFDFILMPRPNLTETFLNSALNLVKSGGRIYYYGFGKREEVLDEVRRDVKKSKKKIGKLKMRKAGNIAPYKFRWLVEFDVI